MIHTITPGQPRMADVLEMAKIQCSRPWPAQQHAIYKTEKARRRSSSTMIGLVLEV